MGTEEEIDGYRESPQRRLFHKTRGGVDFQRLFEQMIPAALAAGVVIFTTTKVTESQVTELKSTVQSGEQQRTQMQRDQQEVSAKLIELNAKVTAYLGTQNNINAQQNSINERLEARMLYVERAAAVAAAAASKKTP